MYKKKTMSKLSNKVSEDSEIFGISIGLIVFLYLMMYCVCRRWNRNADDDDDKYFNLESTQTTLAKGAIKIILIVMVMMSVMNYITALIYTFIHYS